ncbi:cell division protein ZapA [Allorhizobium sp. BGMRC 0089]|uniref:cell division protein ZapA n=1 Tax=Allorhizobium sonneratiae TaxID=2934936 RepID=UPI0020338FF5|nr:cell division protein ZapA [Allorhizobium sonneratiae]MCM2290905.1 cell division protein ZapA [Allorhizobium sonneratiae]
MAQVTVTIDGKAYRMACEEGQEQHLIGLATEFDRYVGHLKHQFGEIGDLRLTVMAAIMIMDEFQEMRRRLANLEQSNGHADQREEDIVNAILTLTERLNELTGRLSNPHEPQHP